MNNDCFCTFCITYILKLVLIKDLVVDHVLPSYLFIFVYSGKGVRWALSRMQGCALLLEFSPCHRAFILSRT